jgi:hypothetical protein
MSYLGHVLIPDADASFTGSTTDWQASVNGTIALTSSVAMPPNTQSLVFTSTGGTPQDGDIWAQMALSSSVSPLPVQGGWYTAVAWVQGSTIPRQWQVAWTVYDSTRTPIVTAASEAVTVDDNGWTELYATVQVPPSGEGVGVPAYSVLAVNALESLPPGEVSYLGGAGIWLGRQPQGGWPSGEIVALSDLVAYLRYGSTSSYDAEILQAHLDAAVDFVEQRCGPVAPRYFAERRSGWEGTVITLEHTPVVAPILAVIEHHSTGGAWALDESTPSNPQAGYQIDYQTGELVRVFQGGWPFTFFPGLRNISIHYVAGYEIVPPALRLATLELAAHWWRAGYQSAVTLGGMSGGAPAPEAVVPGAWAGVPYRVEAKLEPYTHRVIA